MKRLLFAPAVIGVIGTAAAVGYVTGYLWPVAVTAYRWLHADPCNEADWPA